MISQKRDMLASIIVLQYMALAWGGIWGWSAIHHRPTPLYFSSAGKLGLMLILLDGTLLARPWKVGWEDRIIRCGFQTALATYALLIMLSDPFIGMSNHVDFIKKTLLMSPFLLAVGPLLRRDSWLAALGAALLFASSLAMLMHNACCRGGVTGFFHAEVY